MYVVNFKYVLRTIIGSVIPTGRQKPVLDDNKTVLIERYTNSNIDINPNLCF